GLGERAARPGRAGCLDRVPPGAGGGRRLGDVVGAVDTPSRPGGVSHLDHIRALPEKGRLPMRALVAFESMFGNTGLIAEAIADGLARHGEVETAEVGTAPVLLPAEVDLLVVGGPTHAFGMSRPGTRSSAKE